MTTLGRPQTRVIYQRLAPPRTAPAFIRAIYEYGCHVFRELFLGGRTVSQPTAKQAFAVMEAYKHSKNERRIRSNTVFAVDQMEMERHPPLDENGNEMWGDAIARLHEFEREASKQFREED